MKGDLPPQKDEAVPDEIARFIEYTFDRYKIDRGNVVESLLDEQARIREKYGLPKRIIGEDINDDYYQIILGLVKANGLTINRDARSFLDGRGVYMAGRTAVFDDASSIIHLPEDFDSNSPSDVLKLEHELLHGLQLKHPERDSLDEVDLEWEAVVGVTGTSGRLGERHLRRTMQVMLDSINYRLESLDIEKPWNLKS